MSATATMERLWDLDAPASESATTLDALISGTWAQLARHRVARCPMCGEDLVPQYGAHAMPVAGRCTSCHTELR